MKRQRDKFWMHRGNGKYIGSIILVCAKTKGEGEVLIRQELDRCGLMDESMSVVQLNPEKNRVLLCVDGDY